MKHRVSSKVMSWLLVLAMLVGMVPEGVITARAAGVPETLVTSLTELYSGDETHAREDLEAMYAAGILDDNGKLVELDLREDGESVELAEVAERIANGETVGALTVSGNDATPEQIVQISQVKSAIEIAELLDEEIDVTDEHVSNLESLLTGIQDGTVDLESSLKTGTLGLRSVGSTPLLGAGNDGENDLTISDDEKHYIGRYVSGSESNATYEFNLDTDDTSYYTDPQYSGYIGGSNAQTTAGTISLSFPSVNHKSPGYSAGYLQFGDSVYYPHPITVTATLDQAQPYPVSFDWKFSGGNNDTSTPRGTVTWEAGESGDKTFDLYLTCPPNAIQNHIGKAGYQFNASNISNALFEEGSKKTYTRT